MFYEEIRIKHVICCISFCSLRILYSSKFILTLKRQSQQLSSALSSASYFKSHCCKQCGPRSDCSFRSSLIWVHTVCLYAKSKFEKFARRCSRRHKQTTFSDADFLGPFRVNGSIFGNKCCHCNRVLWLIDRASYQGLQFKMCLGP